MFYGLLAGYYFHCSSIASGCGEVLDSPLFTQKKENKPHNIGGGDLLYFLKLNDDLL